MSRAGRAALGWPPKGRPVVLFGTITVLLGIPGLAWAQMCTATTGSPQVGGTIGVSGFGVSSSTLTSAFQFWSSCPGYGTSQPQFVVANPNQSYNKTISIVFHSGYNPLQPEPKPGLLWDCDTHVRAIDDLALVLSGARHRGPDRGARPPTSPR
jgi:hypothetical protein